MTHMGPTELNGVFASGLVSEDALQALLPVAVYVLAMAVYAIFIFKFYRFIANRDIFSFDLSKNDQSSVPALRNLFSLIGYVAKFIIMFPAFAFVWFATLTVMLTLLSADRQLSDILLIALVAVCAVRVCAYYDEDLARDLAKILPFAVLSVFLVGTSSPDIPASLEVLAQVSQGWETIFYYWLFLVALELGLRLVFGISKWIFQGKKREQPVPTAENPSQAATDD